MTWVEIFAVFVVSHLVGDYILQTEWQALNKRGGLTGTPVMRRALLTHVAVYTITFVPALIWLSDSLGAAVFALAAGIALPHLVQDDGQLLTGYARRFKRTNIAENPSLGLALDQSFHVLTLFITALIVGT